MLSMIPLGTTGWAQEAKKDLTAFIRKRQELLPEQAQSKRKFATLNRLLGSLKALKRETEALKLLSAPLVRELDLHPGDDLDMDFVEEDGTLYVKKKEMKWEPPDWLTD